MRSDPTILAFDTSAAHCAVALLRGGEIVAAHADPMSRGQAEQLMPLLEDMLARNSCSWQKLDAIGVGIGPGNFTGIRISVSAARGLALGLGVPAVGVTGCDALAELAEPGRLPAIPAPREQVYVQTSGSPPRLIARAEAEALGSLYLCDEPDKQVCAIARLTERRWTTPQSAPAPLYVRPVDAAPSREVPPVLLSE